MTFGLGHHHFHLPLWMICSGALLKFHHPMWLTLSLRERCGLKVLEDHVFITAMRSMSLSPLSSPSTSRVSDSMALMGDPVVHMGQDGGVSEVQPF